MAEDRPLTAKQRAFVREVLREDEPVTQVDAYRAVYNSQATGKTQRTEAARVASRPHVARAIEEGRAAQERSIQAAARGRRRWVLERLASEAESAESDAARVRALEVIGRASGLFEPETEATGGRAHATADDLRQELESRLAEALGVVEVEQVEVEQPLASAATASAERAGVAQRQPASGAQGQPGSTRERH